MKHAIVIFLFLFTLLLNAKETKQVSVTTDNLLNSTNIIQLNSTSSEISVNFSSGETSRSNAVCIEQTGYLNSAIVTVDGSDNGILNIKGIESQSRLTLIQDNDNYKAEISIKSSNKNDAGIHQYGIDNTASILQKEGFGNQAWIEQGNKNTASIFQSGSHHTAVIIQK